MKKSYLIAMFGLLVLVACNNQKKAESATEVEAEAVVEEAVVEETDSLAAEAADTTVMETEVVEEVSAE